MELPETPTRMIERMRCHDVTPDGPVLGFADDVPDPDWISFLYDWRQTDFDHMEFTPTPGMEFDLEVEWPAGVLATWWNFKYMRAVGVSNIVGPTDVAANESEAA